ncbi:IS5 family transposase [uncultured Vibrio sp.]|uniref:IS5 family transposase n=1 Tax=uncultured Vibrio sp. TaxID=114054 RepID=UPI002AA5EDA7|nr:IS5 family transposase [uncultured Vibrio sp.]
MIQPGFFDLQERLHKIDKNGDPLTRLNQTINWEMFRPAIEKVRDKKRQSNVGPKGYDAVLLFKILILQSLYNLSDDATEYQILDRYSFSRFLDLHISQKVPDATTIWRFREDLIEAGVIDQLFSTFDEDLRAHGFMAMKGQIVDASIVNVPRQRNSREENAEIKEGNVPDWSVNKRRQKDVDARWTKKNGKTFYGYKNHISVDVKYKFIRSFAVTDAALHDSQVFEQLLTDNTSKDIWADSAYRSEDRLNSLAEDGFREHIQRKGTRNRQLTPREQDGNRTRSKIRSRIEHVFGVQAQRAGYLLLRTIGIARARTKIGLRNLAYNLDRMGILLCPCR